MKIFKKWRETRKENRRIEKEIERDKTIITKEIVVCRGKVTDVTQESYKKIVWVPSGDLHRPEEFIVDHWKLRFEDGAIFYVDEPPNPIMGKNKFEIVQKYNRFNELINTELRMAISKYEGEKT